MMLLLLLITFLIAVTASRHPYHESISTRNLSHVKRNELIPSIAFLGTYSPLLNQDKISVQYKFENIPRMLLRDGRVRVSVWLCYFQTACASDEHFAFATSITFQAEPKENSSLITFYSDSIDLNAPMDGMYRLRLVMDIINPSVRTECKPYSAIDQFMDEVTVTHKKFVMPQIDVWWNSEAPTEYSTGLGSMYFAKIQSALNGALSNSSKLTETELDLIGFSGSQFRHFYNNLGALIRDIHYLEIGVYAGSTMMSMLAENSGNVKTVVGIDYWSDGDWLGDHYGGMSVIKKEFDQLLPQYISESQNIHILHADYLNKSYHDVLSLTGGQRFNIYLFDGPHEPSDHFFAIVNYFPALADTFILVVDDWNWEKVRVGTETAFAALNDQMLVLGKIELFTGEHPPEGVEYPWHNGMAVFVIQKQVIVEVAV